MRILLDNAVRVSPQGGEITVELRNGEQASLTVRDEGPGVPPEERELIFERFQRGRATGGSAGFGLGLAIGRELAERMGGELVLERADVPGAKFTLRLPVARRRRRSRSPSGAKAAPGCRTTHAVGLTGFTIYGRTPDERDAGARRPPLVVPRAPAHHPGRARPAPAPAGARVLDAGCGSGRTLEELGRYGEVYGIELDPGAADVARARGRGRGGDRPARGAALGGPTDSI